MTNYWSQVIDKWWLVKNKSGLVNDSLWTVLFKLVNVDLCFCHYISYVVTGVDNKWLVIDIWWLVIANWQLLINKGWFMISYWGLVIDVIKHAFCHWWLVINNVWMVVSSWWNMIANWWLSFLIAKCWLVIKNR